MNSRKTLVFILALLVGVTLAAPLLRAQSLTTGDVVGTVTDPSGAVVPGATVTLKNNGTGVTQTATITSSGGLQLLGAGTFTLTQSNPVTPIAVATSGGAVSITTSAAVVVAR